MPFIGNKPSAVPLTSADITDGIITSAKIADGTIATADLNTGLTVNLGAGAVGTPTLTTSGDTNTGIFFPAADTIGFAEGGAEALRINSDAQTVHPLGTALLPSMTFTGDVNTGIFSPTADTIAFTEGGSEAMRINSSGQVLVGMTTTDGSVSSGNKLLAGLVGTVIKFRTFSATNTYETLETLPSNYGQILVCARGSGGGNATTDDAIAFFCINNSSTTQTDIKTATKVTLRMSGLDLQASQSFFSTANISYSILRLNA